MWYDHHLVWVPLMVAIMWWRTARIGGAHRKIHELRRENEERDRKIAELEKFKGEIDSIRNKNPYEWINIAHGHGRTKSASA